jgi:glucose-1-phosphate adenylyltransferase
VTVTFARRHLTPIGEEIAMNHQQELFTAIMAGGRGARLHPLTRDRAKPAVPFGGIYRIIDFTLNNCINSGLHKVLVLTQYKSASLERHIKRGWNFLPSTLGQYIDVVPPQQRVGTDWYKGTADAVYQNIYSARRENCPYTLILAGDHIYKMDYRKMLAFHLEKKADVTVAAVDMPISMSKHFGVIEMDEKHHIIGFQEKIHNPKPMPGHPDKCLASMGIYIFNSEVMYDLLERDAKDDNSSHDFGKDVIPSIIDSHRAYCYLFLDENKKSAKYWRDVGTIDAYWEANIDLVNVSPLFNLYDEDWSIRTLHVQAPPPKFVFAQTPKEGGRRGVALDSIISAGCVISGGKVEGSVLSPDVRINSYSSVLESILFNRVDIGRHCRIQRTIIDKDVAVPERSAIGYDLDEDRKRFFVSPGGVVVIPKGEQIPAPRKVFGVGAPEGVKTQR